MKFPTIGDVATTLVVSIDSRESIASAIEKMLKNEHRNIVVIDEGKFKILTVSDMLSIKKQDLDLGLPVKILELQAINTINKEKSILHALEFLSCDVEHICSLNDDDTLHGLITHTDIVSNIDPETLMDNFCLDDFLKLSKRVKWVKKEDMTSDIFEEMVKNSLDSVIIVENFIPIGIFTTKDIIRLVKNGDDFSLPIKNYMTTPVDTINKSSSVKATLEYIKRKKFKRAVVVDDNGKISGVVSQKELISTTYSKWAVLMKEHQEELSLMNEKLLNKSKKLEQLASMDALTGLYNRHKFSELYHLHYDEMVQKNTNSSLVMIDIDKFKKINDTYGHAVGDSVLVLVANTILHTIRHGDVVCRWGGEEFLVLLLDSNLEMSMLVMEKVRLAIQNIKLEPVEKITASFGVTQIRVKEEMIEAISRADQALYMAKNSGRNCVKSELDL